MLKRHANRDGDFNLISCWGPENHTAGQRFSEVECIGECVKQARHNGKVTMIQKSCKRERQIERDGGQCPEGGRTLMFLRMCEMQYFCSPSVCMSSATPTCDRRENVGQECVRERCTYLESLLTVLDGSHLLLLVLK